MDGKLLSLQKGNANLPNSGTIAMTVVCTIMLSILAHGITAHLWARAYGERGRLANEGTQTGA